jgi:transcriptional regulator with XRE-family HTH domain
VDVHNSSPIGRAKICYLSAERIVSLGRNQARETIALLFVSGNRNRCIRMVFLPVQSRMARAGLGWGIRELARAAKVSVDTVVRFERGEELKERTVEALQRAFEAAGLEFMNGDRPGLRLGNSVAANRLPHKTAVAEPKREQKEFWSQRPPSRRKEP